MKALTQKLMGALLIITGIMIISSCSNQQDEQQSKALFQSDTIIIQSMQFSPSELESKIGDTITWINKDLVDHNVMDTLQNLFYSDTLKNGRSFRWVAAGDAKYICTLHPTMSGQIEIINQ